MEEYEKKLYIKALKLKGEGSQLDILGEEAAEVIHAASKYKRANEGLYEKSVLRDNLIEELSDLHIMINQILTNFDAEDDFNTIVKQKLARLDKRLDILETKNE